MKVPKDTPKVIKKEYRKRMRMSMMDRTLYDLSIDKDLIELSIDYELYKLSGRDILALEQRTFEQGELARQNLRLKRWA